MARYNEAQQVFQLELPLSAVAILTIPTGAKSIELTHIRAVNTTGGAVTFTLYHDPSGTATFNAGTTIHQESLAANTTTVVAQAQIEASGITVEASDTFGASAGSASSITLTGYGVVSQDQDAFVRSFPWLNYTFSTPPPP